MQIIAAYGGVGLRQAKLFAGRLVGVLLQKRVVVQHLPHFLAQFQRGQLQQPDGLLQLRRERQVLGNPKRKALPHVLTS